RCRSTSGKAPPGASTTRSACGCRRWTARCSPGSTCSTATRAACRRPAISASWPTPPSGRARPTTTSRSCGNGPANRSATDAVAGAAAGRANSQQVASARTTRREIMTPAENEVADLCVELIQVDTSNYGDDSGPGERAAAEVVMARLAEVGIEATYLESAPRRGNVITRVEGS